MNGKVAVALLALTGSVTFLLWPAGAVINPQLQPSDLFRRYQRVVACEVVAVAPDDATARLKPLVTYKGEPLDASLELRASSAVAGTVAGYTEGERIVLFAGRQRPRSKRNEVLAYDGSWLRGRLEKDGLRLEEPADRRAGDNHGGAGSDESQETPMAGTFNGSITHFMELLADMQAGRAYLPVSPHAAFAADDLLDLLEDEVLALACCDLDADGRLDLYTASPAGDRVYLQLDPMQFTVATKELGLGGLTSTSISCADADADGDLDVLAGGRLFLAGDGLEDRFAASDRLPASAAEDALRAAFVELDGDGYPEIVVSRAAAAGGGLTLFRSGEDDTFTDVTEATGLDSPACGQGLTGHFCAGDWNDDGRSDLFFAAAGGLLLIQDAEGRFSPLAHRLQLDFTAAADQGPGGLTGQDEQPLLTGGACFAALTGSGALDLAVPTDDTVHLIANRAGVPTDVTAAGNEIREAPLHAGGLLAGDLNADGRVDLYAWTRATGRENRLILYRGYGTYMNATKWDAGVFPGSTHRFGGTRAGVTADLNGDGALDLVLGGTDGALVLLVNRCLAQRIPREHPTGEQAALLSTGLVTVILAPDVGTLGARVTLHTDDGRLLGRRDLGSGTAGSSSPFRACLAVREPGTHQLAVRFADGVVWQRPTEIVAGEHRVVQVRRGDVAGHEDFDR